MTSSIMQSGVSGLLAFQRSLTTVGHNITNVNTQGYSRQITELDTRGANLTSNGAIGNGVRVSGIERQYDEFLTNQVRSRTSSSSEYEAFLNYARQVDNMLADPSAGLAPSIQEFFQAVNGVSTDPSSGPARQVLLTQGESLVDRFTSMSQRIDDLSDGVDNHMRNVVSEINTLSTSIADMNQEVVAALGVTAGQPPNDLLDKRDELIRQLAELVDVDVTEQDNGSLSVFVGSGQPVVLNNRSSTLDFTANSLDPTKFDVVMTTTAGTNLDITRSVSGGQLGGLINIRDQILNPAQAELGRVAIGMATTFNDQHRVGYDLNNVLGTNFFTEPAAQVNTDTNNGGAATVAAAITDVSALTGDEYQIDFVAGNFQATNLTSNATTVLGGAGTYVVDGVTLTIAGAAAAGDRWLVMPTRETARGMDTLITDTNAVAASAPVTAREPLTNTGSGTISQGQIVNEANFLANPIATNPMEIRITASGAGTFTYEVHDVPSGGAIYTNTLPIGAGGTVPAAGDINGWSFELTGSPTPPDSFFIEENLDGVNDGRNALLLAKLQDKGTLDGGNANYQDVYGGLVSAVGTKVHLADINFEAQDSLLQQATMQKDSLSGVNLDEEAADLLLYQQAYAASAQVINVANSIFDTLLAAVNR